VPLLRGAPCTRRYDVIRTVIALAAALFVAGCFSSGTKVEQSKATQLQPGVTTYAETVALLGKPNSVTIDSDGNKYATYLYSHAQVSALNFVPIVGIFARGGSSEVSHFFATFDKTDHLVRYSSSEGGSTGGTGLISGQRQ
jgi:hypothetical protein